MAHASAGDVMRDICVCGSNHRTMNFLETQVEHSELITILCRGKPVMLNRKSYLCLVKNPFVLKYMVKITIHNDCIYFNLRESTMHMILDILSGIEMRTLPMEYYGILKELNIGHQWLFEDKCINEDDLEHLGRYNEMISGFYKPKSMTGNSVTFEYTRFPRKGDITIRFDVAGGFTVTHV